MTEADAILDLLKEQAPGLAEWLEARLAWMTLAEPQVNLAGEDLRRGDLLTKRDGYLWRWEIPESTDSIFGVSPHHCEKHGEVYVSRYPQWPPRGESALAPALDAWPDVAELRRPPGPQGNYDQPASIDWARITQEVVRRQRAHAEAVEAFLRDHAADPATHEQVVYPPPGPMSPDVAAVHVLMPRRAGDSGPYPTRDEAMERYPWRLIPR